MWIAIALVVLLGGAAHADDTIVTPGGTYQVYEWPDGDRTLQTPRGEQWQQERWGDGDSTIRSPRGDSYQVYHWGDDGSDDD
jgi:hypothetical protein